MLSSIFLPLAIASSIVPTLRNACSGEVVDLAIKNHLEATDSFVQWHHHAWHASKLLSHEEWLREEALSTTCARHYQLIGIAQFINTEDGDNVLKLLILLEQVNHTLSHIVVLLTDDVRVHNT